MYCKAYLMLYCGGYLANMTRQISMIPWLIRDVQVVVAMVTRLLFSSSEQFSAVQHVEMITILFLLQLAQAHPAMFTFH